MKRRPLFVSALPLCALALLQAQLLSAQLRAPKVGLVHYPDGSVHALYGLPSNYIVDPSTLASADAASFSDRGGLLAKDGHIRLVNSAFETLAEYDSAEARPVLNIDGPLSSAVAWLPTAQTLLYSNGSVLLPVKLNGADLPGTVTSLWLSSAHIAKLLSTTSAGEVSEATVSLPSGQLTSLDLLPGVSANAFHQHPFVLFADGQTLVVAADSAVLHRFTLPSFSGTGPLTFERISSDAVHVFSPATNQNWVVHLSATATPALYQLPAPPTASIANHPEVTQ